MAIFLKVLFTILMIGAFYIGTQTEQQSTSYYERQKEKVYDLITLLFTIAAIALIWVIRG